MQSAVGGDADMTPTVVYFALTNDLIKIGFGGKSRVRAGLTYGVKLIGCVPAGATEEARIHESFEHLRADSAGAKELFRPEPELTRWIECLAEKGYSAEDYETSLTLPTMPFVVWAPGFETRHAVDSDGQIGLFDRLPFVDRVALKHRDATLSSIGDDWYTPKEWADRAKDVMGSIDLDPASCCEANTHYIQATKWYNKDVNGLDGNLPWFGNMWLNPPYGRGEGSAGAFVKRLHREITSGDVRQAITCLNLNSMSSAWFEPLYRLDAVHCIPRGRISFIAPATSGKDGSSPSKGTVFTYLGPNKAEFIERFGQYGQILSGSWTGKDA